MGIKIKLMFLEQGV